MTARVARDRLQVLVSGREVVEIALEHVESPSDRVHMRVLEAGHEHPVRKVDDLGARTDGHADVVVVTHGHDPPVLDGHGLSPAPDGVHRVDGAVDEREISR